MNCDNLKRLIGLSGKMQKDISAELGMNRQRFNNYINGIREPDVETLSLMAKYFGVSIDFLTGNVDHTMLDMSEYPMLIKYRALNEHGKETVEKLLDELFAQQKNTPTAYSDERMNDTLQNGSEIQQIFQNISKLSPKRVNEIIRFVNFQNSLQESADE